jgi:hypothetical protein
MITGRSDIVFVANVQTSLHDRRLPFCSRFAPIFAGMSLSWLAL